MRGGGEMVVQGTARHYPDSSKVTQTENVDCVCNPSRVVPELSSHYLKSVQQQQREKKKSAAMVYTNSNFGLSFVCVGTCMQGHSPKDEETMTLASNPLLQELCQLHAIIILTDPSNAFKEHELYLEKKKREILGRV